MDALQTDLKRIPSLDGLRGIAVLMVLIGHGGYSLPEMPLKKFIGNGSLGVSIFFVLSGFLIYSLSVREVDRNNDFDVIQFYKRRILRIFPCFYLYIFVLLILNGAQLIFLTRPMLFSAATFSLNYRHVWENYVGASDYFVIGHYWTLALEEQFYLTWPLLMMLFLRKKLLPVLIAVIILVPVIRVLTYFFFPGSRAQIGMMFQTGFDSIAAGVLLGELLRHVRSKEWLGRLSSNLWVVTGAVIFALFISPQLNDRFRGGYSVTVGKTAELALLLIIIAAAIANRDTFLFKVLNWRPLTYVGVLSYSLYLWNNLFLYAGGRWLLNVFPYNFLCVVGAALLSHYLVERPFLRLKDRVCRNSPPLAENAPALI